MGQHLQQFILPPHLIDACFLFRGIVANADDVHAERIRNVRGALTNFTNTDQQHGFTGHLKRVAV